MTSRLSKWLRKSGNGDGAPHFPALPSPRPRTLSTTVPSLTATADSAFFQRLPRDIRRAILIEAFGGETMHLDLRCDHPVKKSREGFVSRQRHANIPPESDRDVRKRRQWQWRGSVCHRPAFSWRKPPVMASGMWDPVTDKCQTGFSTYCDLWPGEVPGKCFVGATGWLMSCRQAYLEGVDVLYGTNRMHMQGTYVLRRLPELLPRARLDCIADVELLWELRSKDSETQMGKLVPEDRLTVEDFSSLLAALPTTFPNLRHMYLSLQGKLIPPSLSSKELYAVTESLLEPIDSMLSQSKSLLESRIALPSSSFSVRKQRADSADATEQSREAWDPISGAIWRRFSTSGRERTDQAHQGIRGYWICEGARDMYQGLIPEL